MRILITGATGLVGKKLVQLLMTEGHEVHYLTTRKGAIEKELRYKGFHWDVKKMTIDAACLEGVNTIIHLAGETVFQRWTEDAKKRIMNSRVDSTQLLINLLEENEHQVEQVITASAIGIYPDEQNGEPMKESDVPPTADNFLAEVCIAWESMGLQFAEMGLRHAIVRIGIVLAKEGGALEQMAKPVKLYAGAGFGNGKMWQSWIAIDDLAAIFKHIAEEELEGVFNAVAPHPVRNRPMIESIGKKLEKPVVLPNVPKFVMRLMLGEMAAIVLSSQHVSSQSIQETGFVFELPNLEQALDRYL